MRIPAPIPLRGWTADAAYDNVPQDMTLDMQNMIPHDQWQGRLRLGTRPGLTPIDMFSAGDGEDFDNNGAGEIQCIVPCSNYADDGGTTVRTDRLLLVINGHLWQKLPSAAATRVDGDPPFITTGKVSGVQFKSMAYFCDGTTYKKVDLSTVTPTLEDWLDDCDGAEPTGPCSVESGDNKANLLVKFGARLAMAGVIGAKETWFLSAIDNPDDWEPSAGDGAVFDAVAGGTSAALGYGTIGEPIEALIPFGQSGLLMCGRTSISYLTSDPGFNGTIQMMSRSLGLVSPNAWCPGPGQSVFVLTAEGLLFLDPNMFAVDKSNIVSKGRLDSFFGARSWQDLTVQLVHDVERTGVWIWMTDTNAPSTSQHMFYSYTTNGFFPFKIHHPRFSGASVGVTTLVAEGAGEGGQSMPLFGSTDGVLATFDPAVICGSDGHKSSITTGNSYTDGELTGLLPATAAPQRIESWVSIGPLAPPEPTNILIREVTVESGVDQYIPDVNTKGTTSNPRVELVYGESPQAAIGSDVSAVSILRMDEIILDCGFWDAGDPTPPPWDVTFDGGTQDGGYCESDAVGDTGDPASDDTAVDGGYSVRAWAEPRWTANDLFVKPSDRTYEPVSDNGWSLAREYWPNDEGDLRWVFRAPMGGLHYDGLLETGVTNPVQYVQQPDDHGAFPFSLLDQTFHGYGRFYIDGDGVTQSITNGSDDAHPLPGHGEFGTFDSDPADGTQWDEVTQEWTEYDGFFRADKLKTAQASMPGVELLDLGCLTLGRGNRRRCRVRAQAAFVRVRGVKDGGVNELATETSGHPFVLEGVTVVVDPVGPRRNVEEPDCDGTYTGIIIPEVPDDGETDLGACCDDEYNCTEVLEAECEGTWFGPIVDGFPRCDDDDLDCDTPPPTNPCCYRVSEDPLEYNCKDAYTERYCNSLDDSTWYIGVLNCQEVTDCLNNTGTTGLCCLGCEASYTTEWACQLAGGVWGGDPPCCDPPVVGSCCECGECTDSVNEMACEGDFTPNGECVGGSGQSECTAACYTSSSSDECADQCQDLTESDCDAAGGQWMPGYSCSGGDGCPTVADLGYCCLPPLYDNCSGELMPQSDCVVGKGGQWHAFPMCCGDGTVIPCGGVAKCPHAPAGCPEVINPCTELAGDCDCCGGGH